MKCVGLSGRQVERIQDIIHDEGAEDTLFLVTADHGTILDRGKLWYGYHNDEEVTRVPLFIMGSDLPPRMEAFIDTEDVAETVASYFGSGDGFTLNGRNILDKAIEGKPISVLTTSDNERKNTLFYFLRTRAQKEICAEHSPTGRRCNLP